MSVFRLLGLLLGVLSCRVFLVPILVGLAQS